MKSHIRRLRAQKLGLMTFIFLQAEVATTSGRQSFEAKDVILRYYECYNSGDIEGIMSLMADDCRYHDMIYSDPFDGHKEIRAYFEKVPPTSSQPCLICSMMKIAS